MGKSSDVQIQIQIEVKPNLQIQIQIQIRWIWEKRLNPDLNQNPDLDLPTIGVNIHNIRYFRYFIFLNMHILNLFSPYMQWWSIGWPYSPDMRTFTLCGGGNPILYTALNEEWHIILENSVIGSCTLI